MSQSKSVIFKGITRTVFLICPLLQILFYYKQSVALSLMLLLLPILRRTKFKPPWDQSGALSLQAPHEGGFADEVTEPF